MFQFNVIGELISNTKNTHIDFWPEKNTLLECSIKKYVDYYLCLALQVSKGTTVYSISVVDAYRGAHHGIIIVVENGPD